MRFGAPLPLTGPLAPEGIKQQQGYDLWAEQANKAGGISVGGKKYKVEIVYTDYQSNTPRAVQTTEQMITQDNINFLFGAFGSGAAKAASTVSEKYKVPTIAATASGMLPCAVMMTTGTVFPCSRRRRSVPMPSSTGIFRSSKIKSKGASRSRAKASAPSAAATTA